MPLEMPPAGNASEEVAALIETLHATGQRLELLTAGEIDTVADRHGRIFLLQTAQEQLRNSDAVRQAAILNAVPAHIALLDAQSVIVSVNEAWRQFAIANAYSGVDYGIGVNYIGICEKARGGCTAEGPRVAQGIREVLAGSSQEFSLEYACHSPSQQRWFLLTITPLTFAASIGAVVMHVNITERRQIEDALQRRETELRVLFDLLPAMIWFKDTENRILRVNQQVAQASGKSVAEIEGRPSSEVYPQDAAKYHADDLEVIRSGVPKLAIVETLQGADGKQMWVQTDKVPVCDGDGKVVGICVMAQDITGRTLATQDLRESERRFSSLLQNVDLASVMLDREARITYCNDYLLRLTGWQREEVIGRDWCEVFMPPELGDMKSDFVRRLAGSPEAWHRENEILTRSRERRLMRWSNSVLRSGAGDLIGTASIGQDITEQKRAETKIKRLNRVYAVLSGINTLIVRERSRDELLRQACRIVFEHGGFPMVWIGDVDRATMKVVPVASAGNSPDMLAFIKQRFAEIQDAPREEPLIARVARENKAVYSNEIQSDGRFAFKEELSRRGIRSMAMLPLAVADEVVGVLSLYSEDSGFFDDEELELLTGLAGDIAFALDHIGKDEKIARLSRIQALMSGINSAIVRVRGRQELFDETCRIAVEHGGFGIAWVGTFNPQNLDITPAACAGVDSQFLMLARSTAQPDSERGRGELGRAVRENRVVFSNDLAVEPGLGGERRKEAIRRGYRSAISLPLQVEGAVAGCLSLFAREQDFFNVDELKLLNEVAGNISFALEHIGREEKIARLSRTRALTGEINSLIVRVRDRGKLFNEVCRVAVEHGKFDAVWIGAFNPQALTVTPVAWAGAATPRLAWLRTTWQVDVAHGTGVGSRAIREKRPVFDNNIAATPSAGTARRQEAIREGFHSMIALPFVAGSAVIGQFSLYSKEVNFFNDDEVNLLSEVAGNISFAVEHIDRQEKLEKLSRIRAFSSEINATIVRTREREELLSETCRIAADHGKFELVLVAEVDEEKQTVRSIAWKGFSRDAAHALSWAGVSTVGGSIGEAIVSHKASVRNDIVSDLPLGRLRQEAVQQGCRSAVSLPLLVDGKVVALIALYAAGAGFFDEAELALLNEVAADVSFALQAIGKQDRLEYLAYYDVLTGLANRSLFMERVAQYMRSAGSGGHKLAVALIDLERFRNINESLGRPAGDALLKQVAEWLTRNVGDASLLARVGTDHFAVVLPRIEPGEDLARLVEEKLEAFLDHPFHLNDAVFRIAAKMGIALYPDDGADADALLRNAEAALKKAKGRGQRYLFYKQKMTEAVAGKLKLENQLRQALEKEEFVLHYQPKVSLESRQLTGVEALLRWNDPRTGLVPPAQFIPILEETGLIYEVGRWALRKALDDYLRWRAAGLAPVRIAVNVSPLQLGSRNFIAEIEQAVGVDRQAAAGLELEITESLIMEDVKHSIATLRAIRAMGVTIAIDDFGTGFSSLSYLAKLPVDTLKIDRSFVVEMTAAPEGLSLVSTIISLAHSLNLKVVAEGVETDEQSRLLRLLGCDEMQGYLFSRPIAAEVFEAKFLTPLDPLSPPPSAPEQR